MAAREPDRPRRGLDDQQRLQIGELFRFLDTQEHQVLAPPIVKKLCSTLGLTIALDEIDPSEGFTLDDVIEEVELAYIRLRSHPAERLKQINSIAAEHSNFINVAHLRSMLENAEIGALKIAGGPVTDDELAEQIGLMSNNPRAEVKHATRREFEEFLSIGGPRMLKMREPFDSRPDETMQEFASRAAIYPPRFHGAHAYTRAAQPSDDDIMDPLPLGLRGLAISKRVSRRSRTSGRPSDGRSLTTTAEVDDEASASDS
jgi:hypothetical protein